MTSVDLGTHKRGDPVTFDVDLTVTIDGTDITDLSGWAPRCQFRLEPSDTAGHDAEHLGTTGTVISFGLPSTVTAEMAGAYKGDIELTNPDADPGYGAITFPGEDDYLLLTVAHDSTHPV